MGAPAPQVPVTEADYLAAERVAYPTIPTLVDYLIVSQDGVNAERFTRSGAAWTRATFGTARR